MLSEVEIVQNLIKTFCIWMLNIVHVKIGITCDDR